MIDKTLCTLRKDIGIKMKYEHLDECDSRIVL